MTSDRNNVVGDNSQSDPPLHALEATIQTTSQPMSPFQHADATFTPGPPPLFMRIRRTWESAFFTREAHQRIHPVNEEIEPKAD